MSASRAHPTDRSSGLTRVAVPVFAACLLLLLSSGAAWSLPKGLADLAPPPVLRTVSSSGLSRPDIRELPPEARPAASAEEFAVEVGSQVGRVAAAWSEGTSVPLLGPIVRGFVRAGQSAYRFRETMESRYGVLVRPVGHEGVALMMRRRF